MEILYLKGYKMVFVSEPTGMKLLFLVVDGT